MLLDRQILFIFPGQGSQYVGMGSDLYDAYPVARDVYERANDVLGYDLTRLSFEGPEDELGLTRHTQPALLTHSIACLEVFKTLTGGRVTPSFAAGHSLGEYSALVAAGALTFEDALRLVRRRGELMSVHGRGKMIAFRSDLDTVKVFADQFYCGIGGCNLPEQTVVGGTEADLAAVSAHAAELGIRGVPLNTEGAFHTYLMVQAAEAFRPDLDAAAMIRPSINVLSNYTGDYHTPEPAHIKALLFFQLFYPVKWIWGMQRALRDGVNVIVEFGGGIGKSDGPDAKRPNLESITKRAMQGLDRHGLYLAAINRETLERAALALQALERVREDEQFTADAAVGEQWHHLFLPTRDGMVSADAIGLLRYLDETGFGPQVQCVAEPAEATEAIIAALQLGEKETAARPYLRTFTGSETSAFTWFTGEEIEIALNDIRRRMEHPVQTIKINRLD